MPANDPNDFEHVYPLRGLHEPLPLYEGPVKLEFSDGTVRDLNGCFYFEWHPSPRVHYRAWGVLEAAEGLELISIREKSARPGTAVWLPPPDRIAKPPDAATYKTDGNVSAFSFDSTSNMDRVTALVVNFNGFVMRQERDHPTGRPAVVLRADEIEVHLVEVPHLVELRKRLKAVGGYAVTHTLTLKAVDGRRLTPSRAQRLLEQLRRVLGFVHGANVGIALPFGTRDRKVAWAEWSSIHIDAWAHRLSWLDPHNPDQLHQLFSSYVHTTKDEYLQRVIDRAMDYHRSANIPSPVDIAVAVGQAGLELLSWAYLVELEAWMDAKEASSLSAATRIRLFLKAYQIDTSLPAEYDALTKSLENAGSGPKDGPAGIANVRNDVIHPTRLDEPNEEMRELKGEAKTEAWRLAQSYLELGILALVGYQGSYGSRLNKEGRWVGTVEPVPWATARS